MQHIAMTALAAAALAACASSSNAENASLYYGFNLIDPVAERVTPDAWMIVKCGKIARIGSGRAPRDEFASKRYMLDSYASPGLIDTHAHVTLGTISIEREPAPALRVNYDPAYTDHAARMLLAYGITTIRNPGGDADINVAYRKAAASGAIVGPEALVAGPVIDRSQFPFFGLSDLIDDRNSIESTIASQAKKGVDYVKLYHALTEEDISRAVEVADAHGLPTIGHLGVSWRKAADLGVDALVHAMPSSPDDLEPERRADYLKSARQGGFAFFEWWEAADLDGPVMREMIQTLAAKEVHVDLTLIAFKLAFWGDDPAVRDEFIALSHPDLVADWNRFFRFDLGWQASEYARAKTVWPKVLEFARRLHDAGVPMTLGTDQANPFVAPGASLVQEMKLHEEAGIEKWDILRMATSDAARILKISSQTGRLQEGLEADVVFTRDDPTQSFDAFYSPLLVLSDGRVYDPVALKEMPPSAAGD